MPQGSVYAPTIPGVTAPHAFTRKLPSVLEALRKKPGSDDRAVALYKVAQSWFEAHRWYYREACECEAHDKGAQWGYFDENALLWVGDTLDSDQTRIRITLNVTKATIDQATSMLTQDAPIMRSSAGQPGVTAAAANETAHAFLDHCWSFYNLDDMYRAVGRSAFCTGTSFVLLEWDGTLGPLQFLGYKPAESPNTETADAAAGAEGLEPEHENPLHEMLEGGVEPGGMPEGAPPMPSAPLGVPEAQEPIFKPEGSLRYRMLMRDQVAFDPASRVPGGQDGIGIVTKWREPRSRLMEIAPDKYPELPDSDAATDRSQGAEERTQRASPVTYRIASERKVDEDTIEVFCLYLRAREGRPRGDCIMFTSDKILLEGENDIYPTYEEMQRGELWPSENFPVFAFLADTRENCPWGRARTVDAIPIQHAINGAFSKALQHSALMANAKYVLPAGMDWEPNDEPAQVARIPQRFWQMTSGRPVQMTQPPQMPPEYLQIVSAGRELLEVVVGVNAASMGQSPGNQASGRLSESLQKRDDSRIAPIKRSHDNQWGRVQTYALRLFRKYATGKRMLRIVGEDQKVQQRFFDVANLAAGTEIYVVNDTSLPRDPQARVMFLQNVTMMMTNVKDENTRTMLLDLLRVPDITEYQQRMSPHHIKAIRNNRLLLLGESDGGTPPPGWPANTPVPAPWDNALIHKAELERFVTSPEFQDRVKEEKMDPQFGGQSPLEMRATALWTYWAQHSMPTPPALPAPTGGGAGAPPPEAVSPAAPPMAQAA